MNKKGNKRPLGESLNVPLNSNILNEDNEDKKYVYPSIGNFPIIINNDMLIYGYGKYLLFFCLKDMKFIKIIDDHQSAIRSLDKFKEGNFFLTTGDDKTIIIYDKNWCKYMKILHKKKIVKAYFLKEVQESEHFKILFIDKYGDIYIYKPPENLTNKNNNKIQINDKDDNYETVQLLYLYDSLNDVEAKDEDIFFMKEFDQEFHEDILLKDSDDDEKNKDSVNYDKYEQNDNCVDKCVDNSININSIKKKLEIHYAECFKNENLLYPIHTCNSSVISLYYDDKFLIIGDRDEKIRIIKNKKIHKIYNFYLNHKLFITCVELINEHIFCSTSADCYVHLWNIKKKEVVDSLYLDMNFLCKYVQLSSLFPNKSNMENYKFLISILYFHKKSFSLFAIIENVKGFLIIPLKEQKENNNDNNNLMAFDEEKIYFYELKEHVLSFTFLSLNNQKDVLLFVDREKGYLHKINLNDDNSLSKDIKIFPHSFFNSADMIDIGLINYWKHTTIEGIIN
ncbi:hypothetical protein PFAG_05152 [Plasmodium falciparum Santa Lucia]|uniref:Uncharacterized protein n=1 Tax=Plasmodium falciparum Santa Lucia TaxID=478859 RepID=W7FGD7_PLAFA|nr:hypothetical protein PFAG_05152 [Plasmodium falciparum Santa Lucia]